MEENPEDVQLEPEEEDPEEVEMEERSHWNSHNCTMAPCWRQTLMGTL
jgi:hypothetical protein